MFTTLFGSNCKSCIHVYCTCRRCRLLAVGLYRSLWTATIRYLTIGFCQPWVPPGTAGCLTWLMTATTTSDANGDPLCSTSSWQGCSLHQKLVNQTDQTHSRYQTLGQKGNTLRSLRISLQSRLNIQKKHEMKHINMMKRVSSSKKNCICLSSSATSAGLSGGCLASRAHPGRWCDNGCPLWPVCLTIEAINAWWPHHLVT